jgi:malyl-CoA/(S)-citramalyl-CoA lyase
MRPRRSILSVPGHIEKMHRKAAGSPADVVMLDLEDSVPLEEKETARRRVIRSLADMDWLHRTVSVRINGLETPFGYRDLLEVVEQAGSVLDTVVVPKVDTAADVHFVHRMLDGIEMHKGLERRIGIEAIIESARGLARIEAIAAAGDRLRTLVFGVADYSAAIGARLVSLSGHGEQEDDLYPGHRWHFALSRLVMTAKAHGLMAIDAPYGNFKDVQGLKRSAVMACALGIDGKWVIHPDQIAVVNDVFSPSSEDIERARRVLDAYETARREGRGAAAVDGRMVDAATVRLAAALWEQARQLKMV